MHIFVGKHNLTTLSSQEPKKNRQGNVRLPACSAGLYAPSFGGHHPVCGKAALFRRSAPRERSALRHAGSTGSVESLVRRFAEKTLFFRLVWAGRSCVAPRFAFCQGKTPCKKIARDQSHGRRYDKNILSTGNSFCGPPRSLPFPYHRGTVTPQKAAASPRFSFSR